MVWISSATSSKTVFNFPMDLGKMVSMYITFRVERGCLLITVISMFSGHQIYVRHTGKLAGKMILM